MFKEYSRFDATALAVLIRNKAVSVREVMEAALEKARDLNPSLNALTHLISPETAFAEAEKHTGSIFAGIPFLMKDMNCPVKGMPGTLGSALYKGHVWEFDAELTRRYKAAGLTILGMTNVPEFGACVSSESVLHGAVHNPHKHGKTAGGSSGGSAAAVAAGIVPAAHASDGGGSIRIPASCCGVFGLKPTRGRVPMGPHRGEGWAGLVSEHVISRTVRDSAALLDITHGADTGAYSIITPPARSYAEETRRPPGNLRVIYTAKLFAGQYLHPENEKALHRLLNLLEAQGHIVEPHFPSVEFERMQKTIADIVAGNMAYGLAKIAELKGIPVAEALQLTESACQAFYELGRQQSATTYITALETAQQFTRDFARQSGNADLWITPTLAEPPVDLGVLAMTNTDFTDYLHKQARFSPYTSLFNFTGQPAASFPIHTTPDGLPVGVQLAAGFGREDVLFSVCAELERQIGTAPQD